MGLMWHFRPPTNQIQPSINEMSFLEHIQVIYQPSDQWTLGSAFPITTVLRPQFPRLFLVLSAYR